MSLADTITAATPAPAAATPVAAADSAACDSAACVAPVESPFFTFVRAALLPEPEPPESFTAGIDPTPRPTETHPAPALSTFIIALLAIIALSAPHLRHIITAIKARLLGIRSRNNTLDTHTASETRTLALLIIFGTLGLAVALGTVITPSFPSRIPLVAATTGLLLAYYLLQNGVYAALAYTFGPADATRRLLSDFNLIAALMGLLLIAPTLVILYYPPLATEATIATAGIYILLRITFIFKGFRIFYNSFGSFSYFILYLCALEIIPPIAVYSAASALNGLL